MATQKKTTSGREKKKTGTKSAGKSAKTGGKSSTGGVKKTTGKKNQKAPMTAQQKERANQIATYRLYSTVACVFLAIFAFLGFFQNEAIFISWFRSLICGLIGYGYWLTPFALILAAGFLVQVKRRPFAGRVVATLLTPMVISGMIQLCIDSTAYPTYFLNCLKLLWTEGQLLESGGAFSGMLTLLLSRFISKIGAFLVLLLIQVFLTMTICNRNLRDVVEWFQRMREEQALRREERQAMLEASYDEEDCDDFGYEAEPELPELPELPVRPRRLSREKVTDTDSGQTGGKRLKGRSKLDPRRFIDIPLDGYPPESEKAEPELPETVEAGQEIADLPIRGQAVPQIRREPTPVAVVEEAEEPSIDEVIPPTGQKAVAEIPVTREPAVEKVKSAEAAMEAQKVASAAATAMEQTMPAYVYPEVSLLEAPKAMRNAGVKEELMASQARLEDTIQSFGIDAHIVDVTRGPTVARFELELDRGVKLSKLTNLADDIALSLGVSGVRIAPVPDKMSVVGIEVPNRVVSPVPIREVLDSDAFTKTKSKVSFALGKNIAGECIVGDIAKLPHMLIAGTTGSGKSVCINSLLISLLYKGSPEEVRLIMVDPKKVELGIYNGIPHLLIPVVTEPKKAAGALQWAVMEMMKRYDTFSELGVRKLEDYNRLAARDPDRETMPSIVIVIDELADLMIVAAKEVEESICRIAQLGRAAGMHLVVATQRPSADVITGLMKANIPSRVAFSVASAMESRIILDTQGAEKLVGKGDMLYAPIGAGKPMRVQGCLISDEEVAAVVNFVKQNSESQYDESVISEVAAAAASNAGGKGKGASASAEAGELGDYDELLPQGVDVILEIGQASVSMLQRRLKLGYSRAARLVDQMEEMGIVGPFEGSKPRQVKITKEEWAIKRAELTGEAPPAFAAPQDEPPFDLNGDVIASDEEL